MINFNTSLKMYKKIIGLLISIFLAFNFTFVCFAQIFEFPPVRDDVLYNYMINGQFNFNDNDFNNYTNFQNVHPRLLIDSNKLLEIQTNGDYCNILKKFYERADVLLTREIPEYPVNTSGTSIRYVGDYLCDLAFAYLITGDDKYYYGTTTGCFGVLPVINKVCLDYEVWGYDYLNLYNTDLLASHILTGLAFAYDYCYNIMSSDVKTLLLNTAISRGSDMFNKATVINPQSFRLWAQNHPIINLAGLSIFALSAFEQFQTTADNWLRFGFNFMNIAYRALSDDGSSHEGFGYCGYAQRFMLAYGKCSKKFFNTNLFTVSDFYRNYADYLMYSRSINQDTLKDLTIQYGNAGTTDYFDPSPILYLIADEFNNEKAQYYAKEIRGIQVSSLFDVLYYNPAIGVDDYKTKPLEHHFDNMEIYISRSGFDKEDPFVTAKCGPMLGHKLNTCYIGYNYGGGHFDPDVNHFSIMGYNNEWLFSDDATWSYNASYTNTHNTLLIDSTGQLGESNGDVWSNPLPYQVNEAHPRFSKIETGENYSYFVGEGHQAYPQSLGLEKFNRHFLYIKPDVLIVLDDIELTESKELELRYFPEFENGIYESGAYYFRGESNSLRIKNLTKTGVLGGYSLESLLNNDNTSGTIDKKVLSYKKTADHWINAVAISWADEESNLKDVNLTYNNSKYLFESTNASYLLDLSNKKVTECKNPKFYFENGAVLEETDNVKQGIHHVDYNFVSDINMNLDLILAYYKGNSLKNLNIKSFNTTPYVPVNINSSLAINDAPDKTSKIKAFLWNGLENIYPLNSGKEINNLNNKAEIEKIEFPTLSLFKNTYHIKQPNDILDNTFLFFYSDSDNVTNIIPDITLSQGAIISPPLGTEFDFTTGDVSLYVTSEDGKITNSYKIKGININNSVPYKYINEDFSQETVGTVYDALIEKNFDLNSGYSLSYSHNTNVWATICTDINLSNYLTFTTNKDGNENTIRIPKYSSNYAVGETSSASFVKMRMKIDNNELLTYGRMNTATLSINNIVDFIFSDIGYSDHNGNELVKMSIMNTENIVTYFPLGEWVDIELILFPKGDNTFDSYYFVNGDMQFKINTAYPTSNTFISGIKLFIKKNTGRNISFSDISIIEGEIN